MEAFMALIPYIFQLCMGGGILYLLADKLITSKRDKQEIENMKIQNASDVVEFYSKVRGLIDEETRPIKDKVTELEGRINWLQKYVCFRNCNKRLKDEPEVKAVANEE